MSLELESKLSAAIELTQWFTSIVAATAKQSIESNSVLLVATSLVCLLGTFVSYKVVCAVSNAKKPATNSAPEIATVEPTKIDSVPMTTTKTIETEDSQDFPCIDLVHTDDVESDNDISEKEDPNEEAYNPRLTKYSDAIQIPRLAKYTDIIQIESNANDTSSDEEDDMDDWNEGDYNETFPVSKPTARAPAPKKVSVSKPKSNANVTSSDEEDDMDDWNEEDYKEQFPVSKPIARAPAPKKPTTTKAAKKESLSQMRKRVAREMKESEERRRQRAAPETAPALTKKIRKETVKTAPALTKKIRRESVRQMKARVAREFAAKLKK